jgi:hypothetical protein
MPAEAVQGLLGMQALGALVEAAVGAGPLFNSFERCSLRDTVSSGGLNVDGRKVSLSPS